VKKTVLGVTLGVLPAALLIVMLGFPRPAGPYPVRIIAGPNQGRAGNVVSYSWAGLRLCVNVPATAEEDAARLDAFRSGRAWVYVWKWETRKAAESKNEEVSDANVS